MHRIAAVTIVVAAALAVSPSASAAPSGTSSCPSSSSGFTLWDTSTQPYQADNGADHNGNGVACAKPTDKTFVLDGVTYVIYIFIDDVLR